jgi:hypothetical protein
MMHVADRVGADKAPTLTIVSGIGITMAAVLIAHGADVGGNGRAHQRLGSGAPRDNRLLDPSARSSSPLLGIDESSSSVLADCPA